jgi:O-antigen ligase
MALAGLAVMGLVVLRTVSLGAWAGTAAATLVLLGQKSRRWLLVGMAVFIACVIAASVVLPSTRTWDRFNATTGTGLFRLQVWTSALHMVADHPVLGIGLDNFLYAYRGGYMLPDAWEEPNLSHPHNVVLHLWLQTGILGLGAFVVLFVWATYTAFTTLRKPRGPLDQLVGAAALGIMTDFLVHGLLDNSYFLVDSAMIWWLVIALLLCVRSDGRGDRSTGSTSARAVSPQESSGTYAANGLAQEGTLRGLAD